MVEAYFAIAVAAVLLWLPILLNFYRNWVRRRNPISLSICAAVVLLMWWAIAGIWEVSGAISQEVVAFASVACSMSVAIYANVTFYWARRNFSESRKD